jgi:hypothetical protein
MFSTIRRRRLVSFSADGAIEAKPFATQEEAETFMMEELGKLVPEVGSFLCTTPLATPPMGG